MTLHFAELRARFVRQMADYQEEVGQRIKRARLQNRPDLSSHEAAAREFGDITSKTWGRWERGESMPSPRHWVRIAELLRVQVNDLRGDPPPIAEHHLQLQLDRIEAKLDEVLAVLAAKPSKRSPAQVAQAAARRKQEQQNATRASRGDKGSSGRAA